MFGGFAASHVWWHRRLYGNVQPTQLETRKPDSFIATIGPWGDERWGADGGCQWWVNSDELFMGWRSIAHSWPPKNEPARAGHDLVGGYPRSPDIRRGRRRVGCMAKENQYVLYISIYHIISVHFLWSTQSETGKSHHKPVNRNNILVKSWKTCRSPTHEGMGWSP